MGGLLIGNDSKHDCHLLTSSPDVGCLTASALAVVNAVNAAAASIAALQMLFLPKLQV